MKIVVLTSRFPYPLEKGDKLRIYHHIRLLAVDNEVMLISLTDEIVSSSALFHFEELGVSVRVFRLSLIKRVWGIFSAIFTRLPFQVSVFYSKFIKGEVKRIIKNFSPDIIYCQLLRMAPYALDLESKKVIDYMDAFSYGMQRRAALVSFPLSLIYKIESRRMRAYESKIFDKFNACLIISEQDKSRFGFPDAKGLIVLPNGVDTSYFSSSEKPPVELYDIGMIGNLGYLPNIEAALYIIDHIYSYNRDLKVLICGARPDKKLLRYKSKNICVRGWVEDIREAYASINIFVAPIFSGTGQQNKILESMALGIPTITTPEVNKAINAVEGKEILIASNAKEFSEMIELLNSNKELYQEIKNNALTFVQRQFSWEEKVSELVKIFKNI